MSSGKRMISNTLWLHSLLSPKNTGSQVPDWRFVKSCWCPRAASFALKKKHTPRCIQTESIEPAMGSEDKKKSPSILKNLLCSTQLGSGNSAMYVMVTEAIEPGDTGSGFYRFGFADCHRYG